MFTRLYLHIPFCRHKCSYCAFVSRPPESGAIDRYMELLLREMTLTREAMRHPSPPLESVYLGGGTPSLLEPGQVARLLECARSLFGIVEAAEITLEANPGTVDRSSLFSLRSAGVTRLSLGVQSFDDRLLSLLGRIHNSRQAREAFEAARGAGFDNIGLDLMHALPGQTRAMWQANLQQALELSPEHLSVYGLTIEEGTPFAARCATDATLEPDDDLAADMFDLAHDLLGAAGYEHYEIANYARPGRRSRHNSGYWRREGYLGLGVAAHSFLREGYGIRLSNPADPEQYARELDRDRLPRQADAPLTAEEAMAEFMFLGLRLAEGVLFSDFRREFGQELETVFGTLLPPLINGGLLWRDRERLALTRRGMLLSNQVCARFLP